MMRMKLASPCSMVFTRPSLNVPFPVPITFSPRASDFELRHLRFFPWYYDRRSDQKGSFPAFSFLSSFRPASIFFEPSLSVESSFSAFPLVRGRSEEIGDRILSPFPFVFRESALPFLSSFRLCLFFSFFSIFFDPESSSLLRDRIGDRIGTSVKSRKVKADRPRVLPFFLP